MTKKYIIEVDQFSDSNFDNGERQAWLELTQEQELLMKWLLKQECFDFVTMTAIDEVILDFTGKEMK